jgi:hypothetical protein
MEVNGHLHSLAALPPGKEILIPICYEAGWTTEPVLDAVEKRKFPSPCWDSNPPHPARSPALYHWAIPAPRVYIHICNKLTSTPLRYGKSQRTYLENISVLWSVISQFLMFSSLLFCLPLFLNHAKETLHKDPKTSKTCGYRKKGEYILRIDSILKTDSFS